MPFRANKKMSKKTSFNVTVTGLTGYQVFTAPHELVFPITGEWDRVNMLIGFSTDMAVTVTA